MKKSGAFPVMTEDEKNAQGWAYVEFKSMTTNGISKNCKIETASLDLTFSVNMAFKGTSKWADFWNKFRNTGAVDFTISLERSDDGMEWEEIESFSAVKTSLSDNYFNEDDWNATLESDDQFEYWQSINRYTAKLKINSKKLSDSITGTKATQKLRLKMYIKNNDDDKVIFYFTSAKLNVEYSMEL